MTYPVYTFLSINLTIVAAFAQIVDTATISGVVRDSSGAVVPQAREEKDAQSKGHRITVARIDGEG